MLIAAIAICLLTLLGLASCNWPPAVDD